jgi:hypothetical protein
MLGVSQDRSRARSNRNKDYGSWRHLQPANPEMMLVATSSNGLAMKITIENQTVTNQNEAADEIRSDSISHTTDFFEARHQLMLEYGEIDNIQEVTPARVNGNGRHQPSIASARLAEEALYWFLSAPALVYLIFLVVRPLIGIKP